MTTIVIGLSLAALTACSRPSGGLCEEAEGTVRLLIDEGEQLRGRIEEASDAGDEQAVTALRIRLDDIGVEVALVVGERPQCFDEQMRQVAEVLLREHE